MSTTTPAPAAERRVLRPVEAADYLGMGIRTLRTQTALGRISKIQLSARRIGYAREDLDRFVASNRK